MEVASLRETARRGQREKEGGEDSGVVGRRRWRQSQHWCVQVVRILVRVRVGGRAGVRVSVLENMAGGNRRK